MLFLVGGSDNALLFKKSFNIFVSSIKIICQLRARRALSIFKDVPLRTRRALLPLTLYSDSALLVLNRTTLNIDSTLLALNATSLNIDSALLALNRRYYL